MTPVNCCRRTQVQRLLLVIQKAVVEAPWQHLSQAKEVDTVKHWREFFESKRYFQRITNFFKKFVIEKEKNKATNSRCC